MMSHRLNLEELHESRVEDLWMLLCYPGYSIQLLGTGKPDSRNKRIGFHRTTNGITELVIIDSKVSPEDYPYIYPSLDIEGLRDPSKSTYPWTPIGTLTPISLYQAIIEMLETYMEYQRLPLVVDISNPYHILINTIENMGVEESQWVDEKSTELFDSNLSLTYEENINVYYIWP